MTRLEAYFDDYAIYHRSPGNKTCHMIGIPLIFITLLGLLAQFDFWVGPAALDGGIVLLIVGISAYLFLDWRYALPFTVAGAGCYLVGSFLPVAALWVGFVLGWVLQFVGHYRYEGNSPAFFKNLVHVFVGPAWVLARLMGRARG